MPKAVSIRSKQAPELNSSSFHQIGLGNTIKKPAIKPEFQQDNITRLSSALPLPKFQCSAASK